MTAIPAGPGGAAPARGPGDTGALGSLGSLPAPATAEQRAALPPGRRGAELVMLCFAVAVVACAYLLTGLGLNGKMPSGLVTYIGGFAVLVAAAHLAVRWLAPWADPLLLPLGALLNGLGIVMIYRLQQTGRDGNSGTPIITLTSHAALYQLLWTAIGLGCFVAVLALIRQPRVLQRYTYTLGALGLVLLAIPALLPASHSSINGAKVWILLGGFSIQPGEFARICLAVFFAGYLVAKRDALSLAGRRILGLDLPRARDLGPVLVTWVVCLLILFVETDIGTAALFFGLFVVILYVATQRTSWLLIGVGLFLAGALAAKQLVGHVGARFAIWLHPYTAANVFCNPANAKTPNCVSSYQLAEGLYGMAFGGIFGTGLGHGQPYLTPLAQSDFILTAFGEELGLTGMMALLLVYGLLVQRGLRAAVAARDPFAKLLAGGLAVTLALQVFIIAGGVTRLIPLTGITTPFLSQGGSSLVASWMVVAILIRISDAARRPAPQAIQEEGLTQVVRAG